jgi:hypothetical protein
MRYAAPLRVTSPRKSVTNKGTTAPNGRTATNAKTLRPRSLGGLFFPAASLCATQYEIPFKLSITTFQISKMAITPAMASHKDRHPSW